jgi:phosphate:Na+ symporter
MGMFFQIVGALGIFLYGMRVMSSGIQNVAGNKMQSVMNYITQNRFVAVLTGFFTTALIQSSSATTVMVVSFVNASLLSLVQAVGVIMGANIGTTVTTWIVSLLGFKFKISSIALPLVGIGIPFMFSKKKKNRDFGEIMIGFGLLFIGLMFLKQAVPDIKNNPEMLHFLQNFTDKGFFSILVFIAAGTILTAIVQSSSAVTAITVTLAFSGIISFAPAAAIVLGGNIGTTITAYIASLGTNVNARRAARAHIYFNVLGVIIILPFFYTTLNFITNSVPWDSNNVSNLPYNLSIFHSLFNIANTLIFLPFITPFAKLVEKTVKVKKSDKDKVYKLKYVSTGIQNTAQIRLLEVQEEISKMAMLTRDMFNSFLNIFNHPNKKMGDMVQKLKEQEDLTDMMQAEIIKYLIECSKEGISEANLVNLRAMIRIVNELENIGDSCYKLILLTERKYGREMDFHKDSYGEVNELSKLVSESMDIYINNMIQNISERELERAFKIENSINNLRDQLKKASEKRLDKEHDVAREVMYLDFIRHFEHIGDSSLNIAQALMTIK